MFIRKINLFIVPLILFFVGIFLVSCAGTSVSSVKGTEQSITKTAAYKGPKARIAVASIKCKAAKCNGQIGSGLRDMLISALANSNRFIVLGGSEELQELEKEINLSQSGYIRQESAIQPGGWEAADIIVLGSITAFEPNAGGIGAGGIGIPLGVPLIGGVKFGKKEAYIAMDLRLVDVRTRRIVAATTVEGKASSFNVGGLGAGFTGGLILGGGLSVYKNTPMEKAVRVLIDKSVDFIAKRTPEEYYRYTPEGKEIPSSQKSKKATPIVSRNVPSGQLATGGIVGGGEEFVPGDKVLFAEDFSEYNVGDIPSSFRIIRGQVEVAEFSGKKWLRALSGDVIVTKKINLPKNFAVECEVYIPSDHGGRIEIFLGRENSPDVLSWEPVWGETRGHYAYWSNKQLSKVKINRQEIHHFVIQQRNGMIKVFVDGIRAYLGPVNGGVVGGKLPNRNEITLKLSGANPSEHKEVLVTNIKVTEYTK